LVPDPVAATPAAAPAASSEGTRGRVFRVIAALLFVAALIAAGVENRRAVALEVQVAALTESLGVARAELTARREHLNAIRASLSDVRERVGALESLAGTDPTPAAPAETPPGH
jgi:hypothetical protein